MARQWWQGGFTLTELRQLRGKSVAFIKDIWAGRVADPCTGRARAVASGTQAVRLTTLRLICDEAGKPGLVAKSNKAAGMPGRVRVNPENVAWRIDRDRANRVPGQNVGVVLRAQNQFGLRMREAWLLDGRKADRADWLFVERGTKGGKPRWVPIRTDAQRELLAEVKAANSRTPKGTLMPGASQKAAFDAYKAGMKAAGLKRGHGLRHDYAQRRHAELVREKAEAAESAPWVCPKLGGPWPVTGLNKPDRAIDNEVRLIISREMGHERVEAANPYLGGRKDASE